MAVKKPAGFVRKQPSGIDVLVVGGGLGGLFAAIELYRKGHDVRIIEANEQMAPYGDFVGIGPSATRQFDKWPGMAKTYKEIVYKPDLALYKQNGEFLCGPFPAIKDGDTAIPTPVSRPNLLRSLYDYVCSLGIEMTTGKRVVDYYESLESRRAGVITDQGEHFEADLIVAADGVGSKSWKIVSGEQFKPKSSGFGVYRVAFPTEIAFENPIVAKEFALPENGDDLCRMYLGPNTHCVVLISKDITTWLLTHKDKGTAEESWSHRLEAPDVLKDLDSGWAPSIRALIGQSPKNSIVDWKLLWRNPHPIWTSPGGLVVQLGDSAHSFLPTSANGATQAMEDAISLASCLDLGGKGNIPLATKVHNTLRFQRVSCAQRMGFKNREKWHHTDFDAVKDHPEELAEMVGRWVTSHDPEEYVYNNWDACVQHVLHGTTFKNTNTPPGYTYEPWTIDELLQASEEGRRMNDAGDWS